MTRYAFAINSTAARVRVQKAIAQAPFGTRVELKAEKRSLPQNDKLWSMLSDIAIQKEHAGRKWKPEIWKILFMHGWQKEVQMVPSLDGNEVVPLTRSSDLSKHEMSELIEFMLCWGAENGVTFHDQPHASTTRAA